MPANPPPISFVQRVSAATAPDRDRFIDAVRAGSLLVVVLGHWLRGGIPNLWKPWAVADLVFLALFYAAYRSLASK